MEWFKWEIWKVISLKFKLNSKTILFVNIFIYFYIEIRPPNFDRYLQFGDFSKIENQVWIVTQPVKLNLSYLCPDEISI